MEITKNDINRIKQLSKDPYVYDNLIKSIVSSIKGYNDVKEAIILSLFMGNTKQVDDRILPGGIKILIIGDHNTGKSTILNEIEKYGIKDKFQCIDNVNSDEESLVIQLLVKDKSIICAGNFKQGNANKFDTLISQVGLSDKFLDCFDLIFLIKDKPSKRSDFEVANHILNLHKNIKTNNIIDYSLLKKYIVYSYVSCKPKLTDEAMEVLREFYVSTRSSNPDDDPAPITVKQFESMIRLAEASAKIKLKDTVDKEDAEKAVRLHRTCLLEFGVDQDTGEIDVDIVSRRTLISDRDKIQCVTEEIELLEEEYAAGAPLNVLITNMSDKYGVSEDKTEEIVRNLVQKGVIYQPNTGYFRRML